MRNGLVTFILMLSSIISSRAQVIESHKTFGGYYYTMRGETLSLKPEFDLRI